jgi:tetratricopeptide (TPR) repeat protein
MAEADRIKLSRKALREPDEFQAVATQTADWLRTNQPAVVGAASALLAVAAVVVGLNWYTTRRADAAAAGMHAAQGLYAKGKYAEASAAFQTVHAEYARTPSGRLAGLYRAHALLRQPAAADAAIAYEEYIASSPPTEYLRQEALLGLGRAHELADNAAGALDAYRQASTIDGPFRVEAMLATARLEDAAGHADAARELYTKILAMPNVDQDTRGVVVAKLPPGQNAAAAAPAEAAADEGE